MKESIKFPSFNSFGAKTRFAVLSTIVFLYFISLQESKKSSLAMMQNNVN